MTGSATALLPPDFLYVEMTNHCNMHCTFCPSDELVKNRQHVTEDHVVTFIRQAHALGLDRPIQFSVLGEPLLNKKVYDYIGLCEELGLSVILITNISLLSEARLAKIFAHHNVALVLSLQTPTAESYNIRKYTKIGDIDAYLQLVENTLDAKFRHASRSRIEIHVASELADPSFQSDTSARLWSIFQSDEEQVEWMTAYVERLSFLAERLRRTYPSFFEDELRRAREAFGDVIERGQISLSPRPILDDPKGITETDFWGWMCAPGVFLRVKRFGLWGKQMPFVQKHLTSGELVYLEERTEPLRCPMANNLTMLADGSFSLCCLDYEGEMAMGHVGTRHLRDVLEDPRRLALVENAMLQPLCRKCQGNLFVFDTTPLEAPEQSIDKFGFGWHVFEPALYGGGGRWTNGQAASYVYTRIKPSRLTLQFYSLFEDVELPVALESNRLYRLVLRSPTAIPRELWGSDDDRRVGLAVSDMRLVT